MPELPRASKVGGNTLNATPANEKNQPNGRLFSNGETLGSAVGQHLNRVSKYSKSCRKAAPEDRQLIGVAAQGDLHDMPWHQHRPSQRVRH